ncbi:hypothetical protein B0T20DRAFT_163105 [Sordaria brevicollis]|uniref:Uncharacterized protein n=1 Tax=Sordaria brevicollis TaxID=83679 RepID=A0AAE0PJX8_SORBR|nr:hypothetical protein B0T20DRAFT_163105 [Sordaria brevicollis]
MLHMGNNKVGIAFHTPGRYYGATSVMMMPRLIVHINHFIAISGLALRNLRHLGISKASNRQCLQMPLMRADNLDLHQLPSHGTRRPSSHELRRIATEGNRCQNRTSDLNPQKSQTSLKRGGLQKTWEEGKLGVQTYAALAHRLRQAAAVRRDECKGHKRERSSLGGKSPGKWRWMMETCHQWQTWVKSFQFPNESYHAVGRRSHHHKVELCTVNLLSQHEAATCPDCIRVSSWFPFLKSSQMILGWV